jgi:peptide/nickel transport system substrate-binding protein
MKKRIIICVLALVLSVSFSDVTEAVNNKQLTIGLVQEFETLNPIIKQMAATGYILKMTNPDISAYDADWKNACYLCVKIPSLEDGSARLIDENGKKALYVDWELHPKATWADGKPVTGHDVKLSWEIGSSDKVAGGEREVYDRYEEVIVDEKNPKKFTVKLRKVYYDYNTMATFGLVPAHLEGPIWEKTKNEVGAYEKQSKYSTDPTNPGLYFGAYKVSELKLGSHIILEPNPHFYLAPTKIQKIVFKLVSDTASLEASLLSGAIDMICELGIKFDQAASLQKRLAKDKNLAQKYEVLFESGMVYEHIDLSLRNPALQDKRVRQALVYAIDRQKLVEALFEGKQKVALHNIHPKDVYYTDDVKKYPYHPEKAKQLFEEAGWKMGSDGFRVKDGKRLEFVFMTTAQDKTRELVQVFLQQEWKKVGVDITIKNEPARVFFGETVHKAKYTGLAMYAFVSSPDSPPNSSLHSKNIPTKSNGFAGQNRTGWSNAVVDQSLDAVFEEFDLKKRQGLMKVILQNYVEEVPVIPLYNRSVISVVPAKMKGFKLTGHQFYTSLNVHQWDLGN